MPGDTRYRVGLGTDIHRILVGRKLRLGGIDIPGIMGTDAHSDGDVVLHSLCDALAGAAGLPDIGEMFPDSDPKFRDADSSTFLREVMRRVREAGWAIGNADVVIGLQYTKVAPFKAAMREKLAGLLGVPLDCVNVKAKTGERMGPVGEGRAVECTAVVLLEKAHGGGLTEP
jgi:2-C-methyl-D-erythritol 2,4-cyclodiphosphate synthase